MIDRIDALEGIGNASVIERERGIEAAPALLDRRLIGRGELRAEIGIADLQQFGIVIFREDAQFGLARAIDAAVVEE